MKAILQCNLCFLLIFIILISLKKCESKFMFLNELKKAKSSTKKKFYKGRGIGTGNGKTCDKGHKG